MPDSSPLRPSIDYTPAERTVIDLGADDAARTLNTLACDTALAILDALADGPAPASEIADRIDASVQNVCYHLGKLADADLVTAVGTWYSSKRREMTVYAVTGEHVELRYGDGATERVATATDSDREASESDGQARDSDRQASDDD